MLEDASGSRGKAVAWLIAVLGTIVLLAALGVLKVLQDFVT